MTSFALEIFNFLDGLNLLSFLSTMQHYYKVTNSILLSFKLMFKIKFILLKLLQIRLLWWFSCTLQDCYLQIPKDSNINEYIILIVKDGKDQNDRRTSSANERMGLSTNHQQLDHYNSSVHWFFSWMFEMCFKLKLPQASLLTQTQLTKSGK